MKHIVIDLEMNALDKKFKDEKINCTPCQGHFELV